nr:transcription factor A, mitochondrial-like [Procambarus clarkii]
MFLRAVYAGPGGLCRPTLLARTLPLVSFVYKSTVAQQLGIPEPPKRPVTPYLNFMMQSQAEIQKKYPELSYRERIYKITQIWKNLGDNEKNKWLLEYKKQKEEYSIKYNNYIQNLSSEQIQNIEDLKKEKSAKTKKRKCTKAAKIERKEPDIDISKPKSPGNAFTLYIRTLNRGNTKLKV